MTGEQTLDRPADSERTQSERREKVRQRVGTGVRELLLSFLILEDAHVTLDDKRDALDKLDALFGDDES